MRPGFLLFVDEAGDEGIERIRPLDPNGSPEYFVMCGILIRSHRHHELIAHLNAAKALVGLSPRQELHFRDLDPNQQAAVITHLTTFSHGIVAVVSNKRNMRAYRNRRVERRFFEVDKRGNVRAQNNSWFYNNILRYLLERASAECERWTQKAYGGRRTLRLIMSRRKGFSYPQLRAYLLKLKVERRGPAYFNNKGQIAWSVFDPNAIECLRSRSEPGLQFADCVASAIHRAVDETWYGQAAPEHMEKLAPLLLSRLSTPKDYGFKLLPDGFAGPVSPNQRRALRFAGYEL